MVNYHKKSNAIATLAVRERKSSRYFLFNKEMSLCGWENTKTSEKIISKPSNNLNKLAFSGIHIISPAIFKYIKRKGKFSIVQTYLELSKNSQIIGYQHDENYWFDIGNPSNLKTAENHLKFK